LEAKTRPSDLLTTILGELPSSRVEQLEAAFAKAKTLPAKLREAFVGTVSKGNFAGVAIELEKDVSDYWAPLAATIDDFLNEETGLRPILLFDELAFFLENIVKNGGSAEDIRLVMICLKGWRERGLVMAYCGSLNLGPLLDQHGVSRTVLGGLTRIDLHPLSPEQACCLLETLARSRSLDWWGGLHTKAVLAHLPDLHPYFLQLAFQRVSAERTPNESRVADIMTGEVQKELRQAFLYQFDERLNSRYSSQDRKATYFALTKLSEMEEGMPAGVFEVLLEQAGAENGSALLLQLQGDDFLFERNDGHLDFSLKSLRDWWRGLKRGKAPS
jgi:hypothetical protein